MITRRVLCTGVLMLAAAGTACRRVAADDLPPAAVPTARAIVGPVPGPKDTHPEPENPVVTQRQAIADGRVLFNRFNCSGCHGDHAGGGMGPSLRDVDWLFGASSAQIFSSIAEGRAHGMPAWGTRLTDEQVWKLVAYIRSMRTPNEPEPPQRRLWSSAWPSSRCWRPPAPPAGRLPA
jgi:cytochrome c oxidase cbb3-type subunit 3